VIAPPRSFALRPHGIARFEDGAVVLLDQTQLPAAVVEVRLVTWQEVAEAIRGLVVRGAPAIGIAAAYGIVLAASRSRAGSVELLREDVGGTAPIARVYERLRRGQNLAQAYAALTGRSFDDFVAGLPDRMRAAVPTGQGLIAVAPTSYLVYGFPPASTITITVSGPHGSESSPMVISPFGSNFDGIAETRLRGGYTISAQTESGVFTVKLRKTAAGDPTDLR
jgi:hypothetical protein